jgi:hypothetical protein
MPRTIKNDVNMGLYENQVGSLNPANGGSFGSFFKKVGKTLSHVGKEVGKTALSTATDLAKKSASYAIQHPELVAIALSGTGIHDRLFDKEFEREMKKHQKSGGSMDGGSLKAIATRVFAKTKKLASKHLDKTINDIKNKVQPDIDNIKKQVTKKVVDFADDKYNHLKGKIHKTLGTTDMEPQEDAMGSGVSGGKRKLSPKMIQRNALVKKLMREHGMKLTEASRHIKEHGLM